VWSNTSLDTQPPVLHGDTTSVGTRKPSPIGPAMPPVSGGSGLTVIHSPGVPAGAVGGGTWSKKYPANTSAS
jgi:hypothetical protein